MHLLFFLSVLAITNIKYIIEVKNKTYEQKYYEKSMDRISE